MAVLVTYDSRKIEPAPLYSLSKEYIRSDSDALINVRHTITLNGKIISFTGSPDTTGNFVTNTVLANLSSDEEKFLAIQKKQQAIHDLFSTDLLDLEIYSDSTTDPSIKCSPTIRSVTFDEGVNVESSNYSIVLDTFNLGGTFEVSGSTGAIVDMNQFLGGALSQDPASLSGLKSLTVSPNISFVEDDDFNLYSVNLNVSASCAKSESTNANETFDAARNFCDLVISSSEIQSETLLKQNSYISDIFNSNGLLDTGTIDDYSIFNIGSTEGGDHLAGSYSRTVSFIISSTGNSTHENKATNDYNIQVSKNRKTSSSKLGLQNVLSVNGTITGRRSSGKTKIQNANDYWSNVLQNGAPESILSLVNSPASGIPNLGDSLTNWNFDNYAVVPSFTSTNSMNKRNGTISYNYEFVDKGISLTGTPFIDLDVTVSDQHDMSSVAIIPIIGRANGPIIQNTNTKKERTKSVSASFQLYATGSYTGGYSALEKWSNLNTLRSSAVTILLAEPFNIFTNTWESDFFVTSWNDSLNPLNGTFTLNMTILEVSATGIQSPTGTGGWENP